jgi:protein NRD1
MASTTPEGSPVPNVIPRGGQQQNGTASAAPGQAAPDTSSILKALADMAKQNPTASAASGVPVQTNPFNVSNGQSAIPGSSSVDQASQPANGQAAVNPYGGTPFAALGNLAVNQFPPQTQTPNSLAQQNPLAALLPQATAAPAQPAITPDALQQVQLLQLLAAQGIPQDQWATALQILSLSNNANAGMGNMNPAQAAGYNMPTTGAQPAWPGRADAASRDTDRDRERERDYMRSPPGQYRRRSRSPGWDRRRDTSPPRRRESPVYGEYHGESPGRRGGDRDARGRRGNDYRQRSPPGRRRRTSTPPRKDSTLPPPGPKLIEWDYSIGQGNIKVLSRTLFVGGVT